MGDMHHTYICLDCDTPVADSSNLVSKKFHGSHGAAYLFTAVYNLYDGEKRVTQMTTGQHVIKNQNCAACNKELGWLYVSAEEPSQQYKVGHVVLERNLLGISGKPDASIEKPKKASAARPATRANDAGAPSRESLPLPQSSENSRASTLPAPHLYQDEFKLSVGVILFSPSSAEVSEMRVYLPDQKLPVAPKRPAEALEAGALRYATAAATAGSVVAGPAGFMPGSDGREPFAVTFKSLTGKEPVEIVSWFLLCTKPVRSANALSADWLTLTDAAVALTSVKDRELVQKAGGVYQQRKLAASNGEEAVYLDGSWDLVDDDAEALVEPANGMRIA